MGDPSPRSTEFRRSQNVRKARLDGELVWEETSGLLQRAAKTGGKKPRPATLKGEEPKPCRSVLWRVPADAGRRYAGVSGDYNPIHISAVTAKLFGFKRAIVHGMWSLARCVAEMEEEVRALSTAPMALDVTFKTPVLLPCHVAFVAHRDGPAMRFGLRASDGAKPHLVGRVGPVTE